STVNNLAATLMTDFNTKKYDRVEVIYHHFKNAAVQVITIFQLLPFENPADDKPVKPQDDFDYIYEPSLDKVLEALIPKWLNLKIYEILADSSASEHGARMIAMHKATDNATELLSELKLSYNKARQSAITNELIEIIGGAEAFQK
ncbi:MAG: F0F1 ATP synthase subunit gamma, partial [Lentimicrobium sp.]|nr:F0F1 ATP synthase subunit gamma [Lentimicrobium sp.]